MQAIERITDPGGGLSQRAAAVGRAVTGPIIGRVLLILVFPSAGGQVAEGAWWRGWPDPACRELCVWPHGAPAKAWLAMVTAFTGWAWGLNLLERIKRSETSTAPQMVNSLWTACGAGG